MHKEFSELLLQSKAQDPKLDNWPPVRLSNQFTPSNSDFLANRPPITFDLRSEVFPSLLTLKKNGRRSPSLHSIVQKAKHALSHLNPENLSLVSNKESFDFRNPLGFRREDTNRGVHLQPMLPTMFRSEDEQLDEAKAPSKFLVLGAHARDRVQLKREERLANNVVLSNRSIPNVDDDKKNRLVGSYFLAKKDSFKKLRQRADQVSRPPVQPKNIQIEHWNEFQRRHQVSAKEQSTSRGVGSSNQEEPAFEVKRPMTTGLPKQAEDRRVSDFEFKPKRLDLRHEERSMLSSETTNCLRRRCLKSTINANCDLRRGASKGPNGRSDHRGSYAPQKSKEDPQKSLFFRKLVRQNPLVAMRSRFAREKKPVTKLRKSLRIQKQKAKKQLGNKLLKKPSYLEESQPDRTAPNSPVGDFMRLMIEFCRQLEARVEGRSERRVSAEDLLRLLNLKLAKNERLRMSSRLFFSSSLCGKMSKFYKREDLARIRKIYELSLNLLENNSTHEAFYIDPRTNEIFAKTRRSSQAAISGSGSEEASPGRLIPMEQYVRKYPELARLYNSNSCRGVCPEMTRTVPTRAHQPKPVHARAQTDTAKGRKRIQKKRRRRTKGCNCSKSKCLRLHCVCFRNGTFCSDKCGCRGCYNSEKNAELVAKVRMTTKDINSCAFRERIIEVEVDGKVAKFTHGCSCSKNNCLKNYCECRKNGLSCSSLCKCEGCMNSKVVLDPELANELYKKPTRKKKKIIFKSKNSDSLEMIEETLRSSLRQ